MAARSVNTGGSVTINGPLAVTIPIPVPYAAPPTGYDWPLTGYPFLYGYYPLVTTFRHHRLAGHHQRFATNFQGPFGLPSHFASPAGPPPLGAAGPHGGRARRL